VYAIDVHRLRVLSEPYGVVKVDAMANIQLIQKNRHIKLAGYDKLRIERELPEAKHRAQMVRDVLKGLGTP
jgi:transcription-repair coupling factor (superfamily II helicase)